MKSLRNRRAIVALAIAGVTTTLAGVAFALSCISPAHQAARLELVSVTVDGVPQSDRSAYSGLEISVWEPYDATRTPSSAMQFDARRGNRYYTEIFEVPGSRDR